MPALRCRARSICSSAFWRFISLSLAITLVPTGAANAITQPGVTPGEFSVGQTGSAEYKLPIAVPPGTAGMKPSLSLNYNSQSGDGMMGAGWTLGGLSNISRCAATVAQDGAAGTVNLTAADKFCIDGQRLFVVNGGAYGADGTEYRTEIDGFTKVTSYGAAGTGPAYFRVWTKSGQILEYGNTADSRVEAAGRAEARTWSVNRVSDTVGNYLTVTYAEANANNYPSRIDYTGNTAAGLSPYASVVLAYEVRPEGSTTSYVGGTAFSAWARLTSIMTYSGTTLVRNYRIGYDNQGLNGSSRVTTVTECDAVGDCLPPTTFGWQGSWQSGSQETFSNVYSNASFGSTAFKAIAGDWNGDGRTDVLLQARTTPGSSVLYTSSASGVPVSSGFSRTDWSELSPPPTNQSGTRIKRELIAGDWNGDGLTDLAVATLSTPVTCTPILGTAACSDGTGTFTLRFFRSTGSAMVDTGYQISRSAPTAAAGAGCKLEDWEPPRVIVGDWNADGRADILLQTKKSVWQANAIVAGAVCLPVISDSSEFMTMSSTGTLTTMTTMDLGYQNWQVVLGDWNGDGRTDVARNLIDPRSSATPYTLSFYTSTGTNMPFAWGLNQFRDYYLMVAGDWNGDGRTDIFFADQRTDTTRTSFTYLSTGTGIVATGFNPVDWGRYRLVPGDWNGDGRTDLALVGRSGAGTANVSIYHGNGTTLTSPTVITGFTNNEPIPGDFNGDGLSDFWFNNTAVVYVTAAARSRLTTITDGLGSQTTITYKPLTDSSVYTKGSGAVLPDVDVSGPMFVVANVSTTNGIGGTRSMTYSYSGGRARIDGRGFVGFSNMTAVDDTRGLMTITGFRRDFPFTGMVSRTEQRDVFNNRVLSETDVSFNVVSTNGTAPVRFPYVQQSVSKTYEPNNGTLVSTTTTNNVYDTFGNPTSITSTVAGGGETFTTTTTNIYSNNATSWVLGRLTQTTVNQQMTNPPTAAEASQTRTSKWEYNATSGLMTREVVEPGADTACQAGESLCVQTDYTYDAFGNRKTASVSGEFLTAGVRVTTTNFDTKGQFLAQTINALGHSETYVTDARFGVVTSQTGPNNLTTNWQYDTFGRQRQETRPDSTTTVITRGFCDASNPCVAGGKLWMQTTVTGSAPVKVTTDILGRELRSETRGFNGTAVYVNTEYDAKGQVSRKSRPYFAGGTPLWEGTTYDVTGRPATQTCPHVTTGPCVIYTYSGLTTSTTDATGKVTTELKNVRGERIAVRDAVTAAPGWSLQYRYDPFGNLRFTTDVAGNIIENRYDLRGRKTYMQDPDMGVWRYWYNVIGELVEQQSPKQALGARSTTFAYDAIGRMTRRTEDEGISTWEYDTAPRGTSTWKGKLYRETGHAGDVRTTTYDSLGRVSQVAFAFNSTTYTTTTTYDAVSRPEVLTYPGGAFASRNVYTADGYLSELRQADASNALLWKANTVNAEGQVTQSTLGNNLVTTTAYKPTTGTIDSIQTGTAGAIQNLTFTFDNVGNLTERKDLRLGRTETFLYDGLYRLTSATVTGQAAQTTSFDSLGNITSKTGVGTYSYGTGITTTAGSAGPHAVVATTTGTKTYRYDANGNMTQELTAGLRRRRCRIRATTP